MYINSKIITVLLMMFFIGCTERQTTDESETIYKYNYEPYDEESKALIDEYEISIGKSFPSEGMVLSPKGTDDIAINIIDRKIRVRKKRSQPTAHDLEIIELTEKEFLTWCESMRENFKYEMGTEPPPLEKQIDHLKKEGMLLVRENKWIIKLRLYQMVPKNSE